MAYQAWSLQAYDVDVDDGEVMKGGKVWSTGKMAMANDGTVQSNDGETSHRMRKVAFRVHSLALRPLDSMRQRNESSCSL